MQTENFRHLPIVWLTFGSLGLVTATSAAAQTEDIDPISRVLECRNVTEIEARLKCFDDAAIALDESRTSGKYAIIRREDVRETRRALFGLSVPRFDRFDTFKDDAEEVDTFSGTIRKVASLPGGRYNIQIDDAVWQTTQTGYFARPPKVGAEAVVTRGLLGSYRLSIGGKNGLKAIRIR